MKINSMKFAIIILELIIISGVLLGLFLLTLPEGNRDAFTLVLGALLSDVSHSINNMFHKRGETA